MEKADFLFQNTFLPSIFLPENRFLTTFSSKVPITFTNTTSTKNHFST